jgi:hypothetical protein
MRSSGETGSRRRRSGNGSCSSWAAPFGRLIGLTKDDAGDVLELRACNKRLAEIINEVRVALETPEGVDMLEQAKALMEERAGLLRAKGLLEQAFEASRAMSEHLGAHRR